MAQKGVLLEAIKKLEINNMNLRKEFRNVSANSQKGKEILAKMARNDSMILDFQYRLENE